MSIIIIFFFDLPKKNDNDNEQEIGAILRNPVFVPPKIINKGSYQ